MRQGSRGYYLRGLSYIKTGQVDKGCADLKKSTDLGYLKAVDSIIEFCE